MCIRDSYSPALKAWIGDLGDGKHDGGPDDPRVCVIKVNAKTAQYAVSKRTAVGGFMEFAKGVATGDTPDVNKLRYLDENEISQCKWLPTRTLTSAYTAQGANRVRERTQSVQQKAGLAYGQVWP